MEKFLSNQKLWKIVREPDGYYYEIRVKGTIIDRIKVTKSQVLAMIGEVI